MVLAAYSLKNNYPFIALVIALWAVIELGVILRRLL
jgi:hypothetical protein